MQNIQRVRVFACACVCAHFCWWVGSTYGFARLCALQSICAHVTVTYLKSNKLHWRPGTAAVKYNNIWKLCYLVLAQSIEGTLQKAAPTKNIPSISQTINILEEVCVWVPWLSALPTSVPFIFKSTTLKLAISNPKNGFLSFHKAIKPEVFAGRVIARLWRKVLLLLTITVGHRCSYRLEQAGAQSCLILSFLIY